ncbi:MAG: hypothetical protein ACE5OZ_11850 [Candidatus Heimdallarchaeota archaeon]
MGYFRLEDAVVKTKDDVFHRHASRPWIWKVAMPRSHEEKAIDFDIPPGIEFWEEGILEIKGVQSALKSGLIPFKKSIKLKKI